MYRILASAQLMCNPSLLIRGVLLESWRIVFKKQIKFNYDYSEKFLGLKIKAKKLLYLIFLLRFHRFDFHSKDCLLPISGQQIYGHFAISGEPAFPIIQEFRLFSSLNNAYRNKATCFGSGLPPPIFIQGFPSYFLHDSIFKAYVEVYYTKKISQLIIILR